MQIIGKAGINGNNQDTHATKGWGKENHKLGREQFELVLGDDTVVPLHTLTRLFLGAPEM